MLTYAKLLEAIAHRDRFVENGNVQKTIVLINPTRAEWTMLGKINDRGAAFVILKDGRIVVGTGDGLSHEEMCAYASISIRDEYLRGQLSRTAGFVELWVDKYAHWRDRKQETPFPPHDDLELEVFRCFGKPSSALARILKDKLRGFMGDVPTVAVPVNITARPLTAEGEAFIAKMWP